MIGAVALASWGTVRADIYKYVDAAGNVYFTDTPLQGSRYKLEWHRESRRVAREVEPQVESSIAARGRVITSRPKPAPSLSQSQSQRRELYHHLVLANARRYGLSPSLLHAVIRAESAYDPTAVSRAGAQGLMQLMPDTAARYGVRDSFDPAENIRGGSAYLRDLLDMFDQDVKLALAGYNAGEGAVIKYGRQIPPYAETQDYVRKVLRFYAAERPNSFIMSAQSAR
ncbi:lytic transglycosylase domain-containing protein [Allochromatium tepidum]|nr:lytic transglycosylase domain-containing protein [Allochromatium tepidum]